MKQSRIELKDLIMLVTFFGSIFVGYFSVIRDHENKITRVETQLENINANFNEMKSDFREIKNDIQEIKLRIKNRR